MLEQEIITNSVEISSVDEQRVFVLTVFKPWLELAWRSQKVFLTTVN